MTKRIISMILALLISMLTYATAFAYDDDIYADSFSYDIADLLEEPNYEYTPAEETTPEVTAPEEPDTTVIPNDSHESDDDDVAIIYLCVVPYTSSRYAFGHSWICIKNISNKAIKVGPQTIATGEMISAGLHSFKGMTFNEEMDDYRGRSVKALEYTLNKKDFAKVTKEIMSSRWNSYEVFAHNCTNFATAVWKAATGKFMLAFCFPFIVSFQMLGAGRVVIK